MKPIVSIIVPIYKTEKYLRKCLDSIISQTLHEIEIICVDDCSPDNSTAIVEEFARRDPRVSLIRHSENLGLGGARNTALRSAKADYIASVDSDDFILPNMMEVLWNATENGLHDVVVCGFERVDDNDKHISYNRPVPRVLYNDHDDINIFYTTNPAFWNKIWRKALYIDNNIFFPLHVYYQDLATTPRILAKSRKIRFIDDVLYKYLIRSDSATYTVSPKHIIDYVKVFEVLRDFLVRENLMGRYSTSFIEAVNNGMRFHSKNVANSDLPDVDKMQYLRHLLMMRVAFLEYYDLINNRPLDDILQLLESAEVKGDLTLKATNKAVPLSILVKTFLRPKMIERFLNSVGEYQRAYGLTFDEVIVGDDSTPLIIKKNKCALARVREKYPELLVRHLTWEANVGISEGRNRLVAEAQCENILLCDDDFILDQECSIEDALDVFRMQDIDILGGWLKNNYNEETGHYDYWGAHGRIIDLPDEMVVELSETPLDCPDYVATDFLLNFYIAKRDTLLQQKWDSELKIEEHYEFFLRFLQSGLSAGFSNRLFVKHTNEKHSNPADYSRHRFDKAKWEEALFDSINKLGKARRSVYRWRKDHYLLWYTSFADKKNDITKVFLREPILGARVPVRRLTPKYANFFVGYYDIQAVSADGLYMVCQSVPVLNRLPGHSDIADIVLLELATREITVIAQTTAWCHQQGAHLQFLPGSVTDIVFNVFDEDEKKFRAKRINIHTLASTLYERPIAAVSRNGLQALSLNFSRLYDYRPGYGYSHIPDPHFSEFAPDTDGIFIFNLDSEQSRLAISYRELKDFLLTTEYARLAEDKLVVNHAVFNTDGDKIFMLLRTFSGDAPYPTFSLVVDLETKNIQIIFGFCSHYHWREGNVILVSGSEGVTRKEVDGEIGVYEIDLEAQVHHRIGDSFLKGDGHCSYSPDHSMMLYDSYSSTRFPYRKLQVYHFESETCVDLGYFWSEPAITEIGDCRCDLHPRWSSNGLTITFDSTHEGFRGVYEIKVADVRQALLNPSSNQSEAQLRSLYVKEYLTPTSIDKPSKVRKQTKKVLRKIVNSSFLPSAAKVYLKSRGKRVITYTQRMATEGVFRTLKNSVKRFLRRVRNRASSN